MLFWRACCTWGIFFPVVVMACPIRIYQAAFDRWQPDDYYVTVEYRGVLSNAPAKAVNTLRTQALDNPVRSNLRTEFRRVEGKGTHDQQFMQVSYIKNVPRLDSMPDDRLMGITWTNVVWSGSFTDETTARILDSPVRQELKKRLLSGEVAVWILLESGDKEKDDQTARLAEETFKDIRANMKPPPLPAASRMSAVAPVATAGTTDITFSLIRVSADNVAEQFLVATIRRFLDNPKVDGEPLLVPVFGRGIMLKPWYGQSINPEAIRTMASKLLQNCSCMSPLPHEARYLLMGGDWNRGAL